MDNNELTKEVLLKVKQKGGVLTFEEICFLKEQQKGSEENATKRYNTD